MCMVSAEAVFINLIIVLCLQNNLANLAADFSAIKELDSLSNEIVELQR